jgi:hypothetical protein
MAVLQISKIQVRRGNDIDLPALSSGEFAWSIDAQRLYIGNGSVSEGAPSIGNTEVVTFSSDSITNLFSKIPAYTYGTKITTGGNKLPALSSATREIFAKLDDFVSAADYGAKGNGTDDDTAALQDAIAKTYLASDSSSYASRKPLRIPAGTYVITGTIYVPPFANIVGDGIEKTVIKQTTYGFPIFQFVGINPTASGTGLDKIATWEAGEAHGEANQAQNIAVSGMTLEYTVDSQGTQVGFIQADAVKDSEISEVYFKGVGTQPDSGTMFGIHMRAFGGANATTTKNLTIKNCQFTNIYSGINSGYDCSNITILNNRFEHLIYGIGFGDADISEKLTGANPNAIGPQYVLIEGNVFNGTYKQAISVSKFDPLDRSVASYITSTNNQYIDCGNELSTDMDFNQKHGAISFATAGNKSVNDFFMRDIETNDPMNTSAKLYPTVTGLVYSQNNTAQGVGLIQSPVAQPILTVAKNTDFIQTITLQYIAQQVGITRRGQVKIVCDDVWPVITEEYSYQGNSDGGLVFSASLTTSTNALTVSITSPSAATDMAFQYQQLY